MIIEVKKRKLGGCQYEGCNKISITKSSGLCSSHIKYSRKKQDEQNTVQKRPLKEGCIAGFVYLIENEKLNIQKIGITGQPETRLAYHGRKGFKVIELWVGSPETASRVEFDFIKLDTDLKNGMFFDSTIPQGYGVGSSGALVAALYDRYALNKITVLENLTKPKILILKNIFSKMESFFHGKSSGLDPLNSYLSLPILIHSKNEIETTGIPSQSSNGKGAVFLLDSGMSSETAPMVDLFFKSMKNKINSKNIIINFHEFGNSVSSTIPLAIIIMLEKGEFTNGKYALLGFGVGLAYSGIIINLYNGSI